MKTIAFFILLIAIPVLYAQEVTDPLEMFEEGQYFFVRNDYKEALYFFKKLTAINTENANFNFKVGECYLNIPGQEHLAVPYFEKAAMRTVPKREYRSKDYNERSAPLHALYYLGNAYRMDGQLESALKAYNKFIDSPYFYNNYNLDVVETEMKSCERAKIIQDSPIEWSKTQLPDPILSSFSEYNPVLSHDGKSFVFVRGLKFYDAVFYTTLVNNEWTKPIDISPEIGSDGDFFPTGMNTDGTLILFTRTIDGNPDIYYSEFDGTTWSKAKELPGRINSLANETFASFGENDQIIYFVSDKAGGKGGKDIWLSNKEVDGTWGKPKNLGKVINTEFDEETPVICRQNKTLFFSSKGHYNMGGFDIFYSNQTGKSWSIPRNIGYPLNTTRNDLFYVVRPDCNTGYYSIIDRDSGSADIYLIEVKSTLAIPDQQ
jgi:tetratricopeptide (TPR) repeat protein